MQRENESAKQSRKELAGGGAAALYRFCYLETVPAEPRRTELQSIRNERTPSTGAALGGAWMPPSQLEAPVRGLPAPVPALAFLGDGFACKSAPISSGAADHPEGSGAIQLVPDCCP